MRKAYSIALAEVIDHAPEALHSFHSYVVEWIDNLHFLLSPLLFVGERAPAYEAAAKVIFTEMGWNGDGDIKILWLPSFAFPNALDIGPAGIVIWHVKQCEDGISFLLSPIALPFEALCDNAGMVRRVQ